MPRLPRLTDVSEVAAQPVKTSTAKAIKMCFISVLKRMRRIHGCGYGPAIYPWLVVNVLIHIQIYPCATLITHQHRLNESQLPELY